MAPTMSSRFPPGRKRDLLLFVSDQKTTRPRPPLSVSGTAFISLQAWFDALGVSLVSENAFSLPNSLSCPRMHLARKSNASLADCDWDYPDCRCTSLPYSRQ